MKIKFFTLLVIVLSMSSCLLTMKAPQNSANVAFEKETGANITYSLRGLYSSSNQFEEPLHRSFMNDILDGKVALIAVNDVDYRAKIEKSDNQYSIYIKNVFLEYDEYSKMAYLTGVLTSISIMKEYSGIEQNNDLIVSRIYDVIGMYKGFYEFQSVHDDSWIKDKKIVVDGNTLK